MLFHNTSRVGKLEKDVTSTNEHIKILEATCAYLQPDSIQQDQYFRRYNYLFENIPKTKKKDFSKAVII